VYTAEEYIEMYHEAAISNMVRHKVPASITLAQGLFESGFGNSPLAQNANNHFGIKCHDWQGETYYHDDDAPQECFRKYASVSDSYADHALFLKNRKRYSKCFELDITDYKGWARELKAAGYATLPTYAEKIISIIERFNLNKYDEKGLALIKGEKQQEHISASSTKPDEETVSRPEKKSAEEVRRTPIKEKTDLQPIVSGSRKITENNGVPCIMARKGDTKASLSEEFDLAEWQIRRYNDLSPEDEITEGMIVYLAPKKDYHDEIDSHVVSEGESLSFIAQKHGLRKEALMEMNGLSAESVTAGQTLKLR
jgi:LysM repeat protein